MWQFKDQSNRDCCLIPEVTGILQEQFRGRWFFEYKKKPKRVFYINRCYRYEKPQMGRYREFTQIGIEILGGRDIGAYRQEAIDTLKIVLELFADLKCRFVDSVKRGLGYYTSNGYEVECDALGAQKQIAGGGSYLEGTGWAIGLDRLVLARQCEEYLPMGVAIECNGQGPKELPSDPRGRSSVDSALKALEEGRVKPFVDPVTE